MSLLCRLKKLVHKGLLKQEDLYRIIIIPKEQENKVIQMRDATPEERESINKYINNINKLTGVSFDNLEKESCEDCKEVASILRGTGMTLDNCIKRHEIWASDNRISPDIREEHEQIAEWLKDYKRLLEQYTIPFDFELYQAGLMDIPKGMIEILDQIRSEIEEYRDGMQWDSGLLNKWEAINYILEHIIDKYKKGEE